MTYSTAVGTYLGLAASITERTTLTLLLEIWQGAGSIQGGLVGGIGGLCRLDASDVKATTSDGCGLLGQLAQSTQGGGARSGHDVCSMYVVGRDGPVDEDGRIISSESTVWRG